MSANAAQQLADALRDRQSLTALGESEGWKVLCAEYDRKIKGVEGQIFDPKTPLDAREKLVAARVMLKADFDPRAIMSAMLIRIQFIADKNAAPTNPPPESP